MKHGSGHGRGRHRNARSPETRRWHEFEPELRSTAWKPPLKPKREKIKPPPRRPSWMTAEAYRELVELRRAL